MQDKRESAEMNLLAEGRRSEKIVYTGFLKNGRSTFSNWLTGRIKKLRK